MNNQWKKYLFWFAQEHIDFRTAVSNFLFNLIFTCLFYKTFTLHLFRKCNLFLVCLV